MSLTSYSDVKSYVLDRADEATDGSSDFDSLSGNAIIEVWRRLWMENLWLALLAYPPQAFVVPAAITTLTITVTASTTALTLSAAPAGSASIANWWILPNGKTYFLRVTAHTGGSTAATIDAAPETLMALACTIVKMEFDLVSGTGPLRDSAWTDGSGFDGFPIPLRSEEELKTAYPGLPQQSWPPDLMARIGQTKIRLSHYDTTAHRVEVPYYQELADPSGSGALAIPTYLIQALCEGTLAIVYEAKADTRQPLADSRYLREISKAKDYEMLLRIGEGLASGTRRGAPYGETPAYGGA